MIAIMDDREKKLIKSLKTLLRYMQSTKKQLDEDWEDYNKKYDTGDIVCCHECWSGPSINEYCYQEQIAALESIIKEIAKI